MLMPPIGNTITLFCSLKNWLNVWKSFLREKSLVCVISKPAACFFIKYFGSTSFHSSKKRRERNKTNCQWQKIKVFSLNFFSNSRNKKAAIDEFEQIRFVGWFVCAPSLPLFTFVFSPFLPEKRKKKKHTKRERWSTYILGQTLSEPRTASSPAWPGRPWPTGCSFVWTNFGCDCSDLASKMASLGWFELPSSLHHTERKKQHLWREIFVTQLRKTFWKIYRAGVCQWFSVKQAAKGPAQCPFSC